MSIDQMKENGLVLNKARSRRYAAETISGADYTDHLVLFANTSIQVECEVARCIGLYVNLIKSCLCASYKMVPSPQSIASL